MLSVFLCSVGLLLCWRVVSSRTSLPHFILPPPPGLITWSTMCCIKSNDLFPPCVFKSTWPSSWSVHCVSCLHFRCSSLCSEWNSVESGWVRITDYLFLFWSGLTSRLSDPASRLPVIRYPKPCTESSQFWKFCVLFFQTEGFTTEIQKWTEIHKAGKRMAHSFL